MAFVRTSGPGAVDDLFLVPIEGGVPRRLTFDNREIYGPPSWTEDGKDLIFSSARAGLPSLWRLPVAGGDPRAVAEAGTKRLLSGDFNQGPSLGLHAQHSQQKYLAADAEG